MVEHRMNAIDLTALVLVIVGAINWGLVGLFNFNLVSALFGEFTAITRTVYVLVGLAGVYTIWTAVKAGSDMRTSRTRIRHA
jgi:uncharacterized membrane protein YuzA (DUF378 family)